MKAETQAGESVFGADASAASVAPAGTPLRILAAADVWEGSDAYAYVRAFRRLGHSVRTVPADGFMASEWRQPALRIVRRLLDPVLVREYGRALEDEARGFAPHLFFVFKGRHVRAATIRAIQRTGAVAINVYPDVSVVAHGRHIPRAMPAYDWVFQTKTFGLVDLERLLGVRHASFLPPSYDPEVHRPIDLDDENRRTYSCDVSFIGTSSPKKRVLLEAVCRALPSITLRIWGRLWDDAPAVLQPHVQGRGVLGLEFAKAMVASRINLAILSEARRGSSAGDQITARTFHIPATGAFMLHERTRELLQYFHDGRECASFATPAELVQKIEHFLAHDAERRAIAAAGRRRCLDAGYAVDYRAAAVIRQATGLRKAPVA